MLTASKSEQNGEPTVYDSKDYKKTRLAYIGECTFEYFIHLLVADSFLAILLNHFGFSDSLIGIVSSLVSFSFLFKLLSIVLVKKIHSVKFASIICHALSSLFFMSLFLIPFVNITGNFRTVMVMSMVVMGYLFNYLVVSVIYKWAAVYIDPKGRARYGATKEKTSLITGIVFSFTMGYAIDKFTESGNVKGAFLFIAMGILLAGILDFICLLIMKNPEEAANTPNTHTGVPISESIKVIFKSKKFLAVVTMSFFASFAAYLTTSFMGIYKTKDLAISMTVIQLINISGVLTRFFVSTPIAKFSDKTSYARGARLGYTISLISYIFLVFTSPKCWWLIIFYTLLHSAAAAGTGQNLYNIVFDCVDEKYFVHASAFKSAIAGIGGFCASFVGGAILNKIQENGNRIFGIEMHAQQFLAIITATLIFLLILFIKFVVEKVLAEDTQEKEN